MQRKGSLTERMIRAARLRVDLYEEVEADVTATRPALLVVVMASIAAGIGTGIAGGMQGGAERLLLYLVGGAIAAVVGWLLLALLTYWIGTTLFRGPKTSATYGELLRTIGFAASPGVLRIFAFIPILGGIIAFVVSIWMLITTVVAVRQALDFTTGRAIGTCIAGWLVQGLVMAVAYVLLGVGAQ